MQRRTFLTVSDGSLVGHPLARLANAQRDSSSASFEEYWAAATIDVEHDRADKRASKRIDCPMLHLWAEGGPLDTFYGKDGGPLGIWRQWAPRAPKGRQ